MLCSARFRVIQDDRCVWPALCVEGLNRFCLMAKAHGWGFEASSKDTHASIVRITVAQTLLKAGQQGMSLERLLERIAPMARVVDLGQHMVSLDAAAAFKMLDDNKDDDKK